MQIDLSGRRALVTGGGTGIGRQFTESLAGAGAHVVICGRRAEPLEQAVAEITAAGGAATAVTADVSSEDDRHRLAAAAGPVDVLVNNAGYGKLGPWTEVTPQEWREVMAVNVDAPFRLAQLLVPGMIERGWGRVINISSVYGLVTGNPFFYPDFDWDSPAYVTSKHALIGLSKYLAVRTGDTGVTVNTISPGMFPFTEANAARISAESMRRLREFTPARRPGDIEDLASALLFLASPDSSFVTGQNIVVDGGWTLW
jgi:NAD(P)-dependent dehydrogenase (short-subunit alcohol dehydrogenase family)